MQMNMRKLLLTVLSALTVIAMLASCVATPPQTGAAQTGAAQSSTPAVAAQPAAGGEQVTLRWANIIDATGMEQWQPVIDAFEAKYPNIKISSESTAGSGAAVYPDVLKTSMASGNPPDLFFMWGGSVAQPFIDAGQALDLAPYYEKYDWNSKFAPWVIDRITSGGKLYGVPYHALGMGFWYRKDIFDQLGITIPKTFADQEAVCAKLKEAGKYCVTVGGKFGWHTMRILDYFLEHSCGPEL